jgi:hypothetical protein
LRLRKKARPVFANLDVVAEDGRSVDQVPGAAVPPVAMRIWLSGWGASMIGARFADLPTELSRAFELSPIATKSISARIAVLDQTRLPAAIARQRVLPWPRGA